jgi:hypothetical protein
MVMKPVVRKTSRVADTADGTPLFRRKRTIGVSVSAKRKARTTGTKNSRAK